jgi:ATP-dependent helicase YprA (DUF1998 family)
MPHLNHARGETRQIVFRREHGRTTWSAKGKRESWKPWKQLVNRAYRRASRAAVHFDSDDVLPPRTHTLRWRLG